MVEHRVPDRSHWRTPPAASKTMSDLSLGVKASASRLKLLGRGSVPTYAPVRAFHAYTSVDSLLPAPATRSPSKLNAAGLVMTSLSGGERLIAGLLGVGVGEIAGAGEPPEVPMLLLSLTVGFACGEPGFDTPGHREWLANPAASTAMK